MPGFHNGPGDALRHIIGAAELRRRAGAAVAWTVVNLNEVQGALRGHAYDTRAMDDDLVAKARALTGLSEKSALVREALTTLIERESARRLAQLAGTEKSAKAPPRRRGKRI